jgi:hypothetical protein
MTDHALNHRFRKVRATVNIINDARAQGLDIKDLTTDENLLPSTQAAIDKNSTAPNNLIMCLFLADLSLTLLHRHRQVLRPVDYRWHSVPVPHHQEGRRESSPDR